uniref:UDENN domain-containing protein n=1 Tax=Rhabditophanes sp. KR3021 TaxID=114890 RepID=A0AC35U5R1_9BILA
MVDSHKEEIDIDEANNKEPDNVHMDNLQKRTLFDHFCVVGQTDDDSMNELSINDNILAPIIDIEVVFTRLSESIRDGFEGIMTTPTGLTADLHHGSFPANGCFLAIRRGYHKAPFVDIGILDKSKNESVKSDSYAIMQTRYGNHASELPKFLMPRGATIEAWPSLVDQPSDSMSTFVLTDENGTKLYGTVLTFYEKYQKKLSEDQLIKLNLKNSENENKYINDTELTQKEDILRESGEKNDRTSTSLDLYEHQSEVATKITEFELYKNLAICIISKYPFFDSFCNVLRTLKKMVCENTHSNYSIERYISFLMYEVIYPAPRYPRIKLTLQKNAISFLSNDASELPLTGASFVDCLRVMGPSNLMVAVLYMLTEGKILFHSMRPYLLTTISESVCALMFPFFWQCGYVPQCPLETVEVFECPVPIIAGVDSNYFEMVESQPADVVCFGLDTSTTSVTQSQIKKLIDEMPPKAVKVLTNGLNEIFKNVASEDKKLETLRATANYQLLTEVEKERAFKNREFNLKIRQVFLRFMCKLMDGYGTCIKPITKDPYRNENMDTSEIFDIEKFISSKGKKEFYKKMMQTQYFSRFIEERVFLSDKNEFYLFFDNCMVKNRTMPDEDLFDHNLPKILNDTIVDYDPTIPSEFEGKSYYYPQFPTSFKKENFCLEYVNALVGVKDALGELSEDPTNRNLNVVRCLYEYEFERSFTKHFMEQSQLYGPKFILFHTFSLWFTLLPSYLEKTSKKLNGLALAFFYLDKFKQMKLPIIDQQVFRVLIHQCGVFGKPYWALKALRVLIDMGETPDAITLPIYHKAVTARGWPSEQQLKAYKRFKGAAWSVIVCNYFTKAFIKNSIPTNDAEDYNDVTSVSNSNTKTSLAISSTPNNVMTKSENLLSSGSISVIADETNEVENKCKSFATKWEEFELSNEKNIPITHSLYSPNSLFQHFTDETISEVTKYTTQYPKLDKLVKEFKVKKGNFKTRCVVHELERDIIQINNMYEDCLTKYCVDYAPSINHVNSKDIIENLIKDPYVSSFGENCSLKDNNTESIPPSMTSSNYDETSQIEIKINEEEKREFEIKNENIVFESEPLGVEGPNKMFDNPLSVTCKNEEIEPDVVDHQKSRERFIAEHEKEFCNEDNQEAKAGIKKLLETIVLGLRNDDLNKAMSLYRNKLRGYQNKNDLHTGATFPMYRDFLFVALERYGMLVDRNEFDFKYRAEFEMISPTVISKLPTKDYPPKLMNMACRRIFIPLDLN